jgi:tetraacyldisaccharide 4'-kinase
MTARTIQQRLSEHLLHRWFSGEGTGNHWLYDALAKLTERVSDKRRAKHRQIDRLQIPPVIVVGNLVAGGGGKSPLITELAQQLVKRCESPAILASGYSGREKKPRHVLPTSDPVLHGDEAVMLAKQSGVPVFAARLRKQAYEMAVLQANKPTIILSDDGLQHFDLPRALEILVFDERGLGNGKLLPAGPLRESLVAIEQADAIVLPNAQFADQQPWARHPNTFVATTVIDRVRRLQKGTPTDFDTWASPLRALNTPIHAIAGIADPSAFFKLLRDRGLQVIEHPMPDHAPAERELAQALSGHAVLMTEKDAVKWEHFLQQAPGQYQAQRWHALSIRKHIQPDLADFILRTCRESKTT